MEVQKDPLSVLQDFWGFSSFRPPQQEIIHAILDKKDCFVLLPTGGGKSICYHVPAMATNGICIVVSPLVALIKDQVASLKEKGIKAIALTSGIKYSEVDALLDNCIYGNYKFLYLSPERLQQDLVQERIKSMNVNLIAIDEAHCISQWGNDFRPAYRNCAILKTFFPNTPMVALTASATQKVVHDIVANLQLKEPVIFKKSFLRPNIAYHVIKTEDKQYKLKQILKKNTGSAIVYVRNRRATVETSQELKKHGIEADFFHGGLDSYEKNEKLNNWLSNISRVMVATSAFGMGIDKPDVETVVHINFPESLESYYQESGRAGRNGSKSFAVILQSDVDEFQLKDQFVKTLPDVDFIKLLYKKLNNYFQISYGEGVDETFALNFNDFCHTYQLPSIKVYNGLKILDKHSIISLVETHTQNTRVQFTVGNRELFRYLDQHPSVETIVQSVLRTYGGIFDIPTPINPVLIAKKTQSYEKKVIDTLKQLENDSIITYEATNSDTSITFLTPREDDKTINVIAKEVQQYIQLKTKQISNVITYVNNDKVCKSVQLLRHFDEKDAQPCGICSVCKQKKVTIATDVLTIAKEEVIKSLKKQAQTSRELTNNITFKEAYILEALSTLLAEEIIGIDNSNKYYLID